MLYTFIATFLFLTINLVTGNWVAVGLSRKFKTSNSSVFQNMLLGFAFISTGLNIWSLFLPVNFYALIPFAILGFFVYKQSIPAISTITSSLAKLFTTSFAFISIPVFIVLIVYALLPPQHGDSPGYHFLSIRWIEDYKIVPGLANIHGRFGFNSSFFVSSAAFAFTKVTGQSLHVLNIVFVFTYYLWLLNKIYVYKSFTQSIVFVFIAIAMFRQLLIGISSPTPDVFTSIIISYVFITIAEGLILNKKAGEGQSIALILLICFAFTVKLNSFPLSLISVYLAIQSHLYKNKNMLCFILATCCIIILPWLLRNYILTGYLVYPVYSTGFLHADWQVPFDVLRFDKLLINNGPKMISQNWENVDALSFRQWFPLWLKASVNNGLVINLVLLCAAIIACFATVIVALRNGLNKFFWLAIITLISVIFWIYNSPDYRFGYPYLLNAIFLFGLYAARNRSLKIFAANIISFAAIAICGYYLPRAIGILSPIPVSSYAIKPLEIKGYNSKNSFEAFPYVSLSEKVKLFVEDENHWCNMAPLPCYECHYEKVLPTQIELRGEEIEDGFRIKHR